MAEVQKYYGPPGTGKTSTLISIVGMEIEDGVSPSEIAYASFTKVAAKVAASRAREKFPGYGESDFRYFSTIHSICFHLLGLHRSDVFSDKELRKFGEAYGYDFSSPEAVEDPFWQAIQDMTIVTRADFFEALYNYWKSSGLGLDDAIGIYTKRGVSFDFSRQEFYTYIARRGEYKKEHNLYDFSDMLSEVIEGGLYPLNMKVLIADECQDNSYLLDQVIRNWARKAERIYLAGDPYQCIYSWSSADPSLFINFPADITRTLKQSYRCPRMVHNLSRAIVQRFQTRYSDDDFLPRDAEGRIIGKIDFDLNEESAFWLFRTRYLLDQTFDNLYFDGVPFVTRRGKRNIFDPRKDKKRRAASRLLGLPGAPITLADLANIIEYVPSRHNGITMIERGTKKFISEEAKVNPDGFVHWRDLLNLGFTLDFLKYSGTNLLELLNEREFSKEEKSYIRRLVGKYGLRILDTKPNLELGTFHSVKGDEAARVIIDPTYTRKPYSNFVEGDEEEHRLIYTAITRSSSDVVILLPSGPMYYPVM